MFSIDDKLKSLKATRDQVIGLYESINTNQVGVPGRKAGPAKAFVVGLRAPGGFGVFVFLHLTGGGESAIYVPARKNLSIEQYAVEEAEALAFVESMGFMMDNLNFRALAAADQDALLKTAPPFQVPGSGPKPGAAAGKPESTEASGTLGKFFASF